MHCVAWLLDCSIACLVACFVGWLVGWLFECLTTLLPWLLWLLWLRGRLAACVNCLTTLLLGCFRCFGCVVIWLRVLIAWPIVARLHQFKARLHQFNNISNILRPGMIGIEMAGTTLSARSVNLQSTKE